MVCVMLYRVAYMGKHEVQPTVRVVEGPAWKQGAAGPVLPHLFLEALKQHGRLSGQQTMRVWQLQPMRVDARGVLTAESTYLVGAWSCVS